MLDINKMKVRWIMLVWFSLGIISLLGFNSLLPTTAANLEDRILYQIVEQSKRSIHTLTIPYNSGYSVLPAVSGELKPIKDFVSQADEDIVAAINGGYFDPINHKTTSFIVERSQVVADPRFNERLVDNPDLKPYLAKILNRAEFRRYNCGELVQYDIQLHFSPIPSNCTLIASLGGGPSLLPQNTSVTEGFTAYQNGEKIRDAIATESLNARSAVGITREGDVILTMVAQQPQKPLDSGISLPELADFLASLGAVKAMNLDGGSSAALYYDGRVIYGRVDREGNAIERPIKSVLLVSKDS